MSNARPATLATVIRPLGITRRVDLIISLSREMIGGLAPDRTVQSLPGCGQYAADAWQIFVQGDLDVEPADGVLAAWVAYLRDRA
jgi:hypothetical protein